ncbi:MAG: AMP-binding protein [Oscillospiraceae bacterium]|nr:AMP-binding protein [Oscillospiraceae bacterium]
MTNEIKNLRELVYRAEQKYGEGIYIREYLKKEFHDTSYAAFRKNCDQTAAALQKLFPEKTHIAIIGATSSEYLTAWFGIVFGGNIVVPLDTANNPELIADEINRSDSEMVFLDDKHVKDVETFKALCPKVRYYAHLQKSCEGLLRLSDLTAQGEGQAPDCEISEDDIAAILFTSGTTGKSKGVMLSHGNLIDNTTCYDDGNFVGHRMLSVLPIHHVYCLTCDVLCCLWYGATLCVNDSLMHIVRNMAIFKPHGATFVPMIAATLLARMQQAAAKGLDKHEVAKQVFGEDFRQIYSGGAYLSPDVVKGYREFGIDITQGYGMTESSPRICTGIPNSPKPDSVGKIVDGCEVKIVDGEIWAKSGSVMKGYYKNPEETANSLTPDGWLRTGDLGYKDEEGYLYITGRKKNLIILSNGENVSPEELENQFAAFLPISEIVVYADGEVLTAQIYPNPDFPSENVEELIRAKVEEVNAKFPQAKRIVNVIFRDHEFVKTASRKIIRARIDE